MGNLGFAGTRTRSDAVKSVKAGQQARAGTLANRRQAIGDLYGAALTTTMASEMAPGERRQAWVMGAAKEVRDVIRLLKQIPPSMAVGRIPMLYQKVLIGLGNAHALLMRGDADGAYGPLYEARKTLQTLARTEGLKKTGDEF